MAESAERIVDVTLYYDGVAWRAGWMSWRSGLIEERVLCEDHPLASRRAEMEARAFLPDLAGVSVNNVLVVPRGVLPWWRTQASSAQEDAE